MYGNRSDSRRIGGIVEERPASPGRCRPGEDLAQLGRRSGAAGASRLIDERGVALDERQPGERPVALADRVESGWNCRGRSSGPGGRGCTRGRRSIFSSGPIPPALRHDVQLLVVGAVQAGDLALEQLDVERRRAWRPPAGRPSALVDPLVRGEDRRAGCPCANESASELPDRRRRRGSSGRPAAFCVEAADRADLALDRGVDRGARPIDGGDGGPTDGAAADALGGRDRRRGRRWPATGSSSGPQLAADERRWRGARRAARSAGVEWRRPAVVMHRRDCCMGPGRPTMGRQSGVPCRFLNGFPGCR